MKIDEKIPRWRLKLNEADCGICDLCAVACSIVKFGVMNPKMSAIKIHHRPSPTRGRPIGGPQVLPCWHCDDPPCLYACPYNAMDISENNVVNIFLQDAPDGFENCISCMKCIKACEDMHGESSIFLSPLKDRPHITKSGRNVLRYSLYKCDMCEGDPACVKICPRDVIEFEKII